MRTTTQTALASLSLGLFLAPAVASARDNPLAGQPAVRNKVEYRDLRLEVTPTFEGTIKADFRHTLSVGAKIEYHLTDYLSVGGMIFYGFSPNTGLFNQIKSTLPESAAEYPTPSQEDAEQHANKMPLHGGAGITFTPWFGKLSIFGKAFIDYDIYISGGFGFAKTENAYPGSDTETTCELRCSDPNPDRRRSNDPRNDGPHNAGFNPGFQVGAGMHFFFNRFMALDLSVRNYVFSDNPSGLDFDADLDVDGDDRRFLSHLFVGVGISFYLPPAAKISK
jgi:outer membrane beta-barrel protein